MQLSNIQEAKNHEISLLHQEIKRLESIVNTQQQKLIDAGIQRTKAFESAPRERFRIRGGDVTSQRRIDTDVESPLSSKKDAALPISSSRKLINIVDAPSGQLKKGLPSVQKSPPYQLPWTAAKNDSYKRLTMSAIKPFEDGRSPNCKTKTDKKPVDIVTETQGMKRINSIFSSNNGAKSLVTLSRITHLYSQE